MLIPDTAGGIGRHLGVFSCTMLMYPSLPAFLFTLFPYRICIQHRSYYWYRYILHPIDHPWICRICRCITVAMGGGFFALILWAFYLARIWYHVSALRRRKGVPRSCISPSKISCNRYLRCKRHHPWFFGEQLYCEPFSSRIYAKFHLACCRSSLGSMNKVLQK